MAPKFTPLPMIWTTLNIALYLRISRDKQGKRAGVQRQESESREVADEYSADPTRIARYEDNDKSAMAVRPDFDRLIEDLRAEKIQIILAWSIDRLLRKTVEADLIISLVSNKGLRKIFTVDDGEFDLTKANGRKRFKQAANDAQFEVEHKGERHVAQASQAAKAGRWNGGKRAWGYENIMAGEPGFQKKVGERLVPREAKAIEEAADRKLSGETWGVIVRDFKERGIVGVDGKPVNTRRLKSVLMSARISGRREHHGVIVAEKAMWPAIISVEKSDRLRAMIPMQSEKYLANAVHGRTYVNSGILRCPRCKFQLTGKLKAKRYRVYACVRRNDGQGGCDGCSIAVNTTDAFMRDVVLDMLNTKAFWKRLRKSDKDYGAVIAQLRAVEDALERLAADFGARLADEPENYGIHREQLLAAEAPLTKRRDELKATLANSERFTVLSDMADAAGSIEKLSERWEAMSLDQKRTLTQAVIVKVEVQPAHPADGGKRLSVQERLLRGIEWRV